MLAINDSLMHQKVYQEAVYAFDKLLKPEPNNKEALTAKEREPVYVR